MNALRQAANEARKQAIKMALDLEKGNQVATARRLGIHRNTLGNCIRRFGIHVNGPTRKYGRRRAA